MNTLLRCCIAALIMVSSGSYAKSTAPLTLEEATQQAIAADPWFTGSELREEAAKARGSAASALPDPMMSVNMANLPVNSFSLSQEPMTQIKVGVSQAIPRGDTRALMRTRFERDAAKYPLMRRDREAQLELEVSQRWLDFLQAQETITLINSDLGLFKQLIDIAESNYASAVGGARQQDVFNAQLELSALQDRLSRVEGVRNEAVATLSELLSLPSLSHSHISPQLPRFDLPEWVTASTPQHGEQLYAHLQQHPRIQVIAAQRKVADTETELARQEYESQWTLNTSYGYRQDDQAGRSRADFFSVGVTFDLPLANREANDKTVSAAVASASAIETEKRVMLRDMARMVKAERERLASLAKRQSLYTQTLLNQSQSYAEAALDAYTADYGTFEAVTEARIRHLNNRIAELELRVAMLRSEARLRYYTTTTLRDE